MTTHSDANSLCQCLVDHLRTDNGLFVARTPLTEYPIPEFVDIIPPLNSTTILSRARHEFVAERTRNHQVLA